MWTVPCGRNLRFSQHPGLVASQPARAVSRRSGALTLRRISEHWWRDGPPHADSRASSLKLAREVALRRRTRPRLVTDRRARSAGRSDGFQACAAGQADRPSGRIMSETHTPDRLATRRSGQADWQGAEPDPFGPSAACGCNFGKYGHPRAAASRCRSDGRFSCDVATFQPAWNRLFTVSEPSGSLLTRRAQSGDSTILSTLPRNRRDRQVQDSAACVDSQTR